jgi:CBS domain-containing protein
MLTGGGIVAESSLRVEHVMNGVLLHADQHESLLYITRLLVENNANAIIVRDAGVPVGIITARDILKGLVVAKDPLAVVAKEMMTTPIISIESTANITDARDVMVEQGLSKLAVAQGDDIVGLLVQDDIIRDLSWYSR